MPMDRKRYPPDWPSISLSVRHRSGGRCECRGQCGMEHSSADTLSPEVRARLLESWEPVSMRCAAMNGEPHPLTRSKVVLTVAHLCKCRDREGRKCGDPSHLLAACQRCHLALDRADHIRHARENRHAKKAVGDLFPEAR